MSSKRTYQDQDELAKRKDSDRSVGALIIGSLSTVTLSKEPSLGSPSMKAQYVSASEVATNSLDISTAAATLIGQISAAKPGPFSHPVEEGVHDNQLSPKKLPTSQDDAEITEAKLEELAKMSQIMISLMLQLPSSIKSLRLKSSKSWSLR